MVEPKRELAPVNTGPTYALVATTGGKYFGLVRDTSEGLAIDYAVGIKDDMTPAQIAKTYISNVANGYVKREMNVNKMHIVSTANAPETGRLVELYQALLPEARERAVAKVTLASLDELLAATIK